ncbi:NADPH-dependent FMN reductase [Marinomonas transparens]|uniref:NAD(P)H-dependent oxidoreductase n=1 Tax=Marinomonas transparens TaxID=2795388 RepID=A0A934JV90_9GAMM|nr:NAD(P)H-dependent oxidoreductase [Marinomonas transparens]MBJ7537889.1 NAD(P)H-dependent oxidoreductase [Marinomonas transparens]
MSDFRVLALSGSLRAASLNTFALQALKTLAPNNVTVSLVDLGDFPLFNPDREEETIAPVARLKTALKNADGLIIASPEYAHGITGVMKNTLDWLVSGDEFVDKPIMLINTSPRAFHAQASLKEILKTMSGHLVEQANVDVPLLGSQLDARGMAEHPEISQKLISGLKVFCEEIAYSKKESL